MTKFSVFPRYTCGSPALVDGQTAERVSTQENEEYYHALNGRRGEAAQAFARTRGMRGIVVTVAEQGKRRLVMDAITADRLLLTPEAYAEWEARQREKCP